MSREHWSVVDLVAKQGAELGASDWILIDQNRIDDFARITLDEQYIHVDPAKAKATPFGGTIAHGFLSLSLLSAMAYAVVPAIEGETTTVNYGFGSIRFLAPVPSGRRIRGRFTLKSATEKRKGQWLLIFDVTIEIEGESRPAIVAEWLTMSLQ
jgi:acyl dehydratase